MTKAQSKYFIYFIAGTLAMIIIACIVYIPGTAKLSEMDSSVFDELATSYNKVSPLSGDLLRSAEKSWGYDPAPYYLWGTIFRVLCGLLLWTSIFLIWPTERTAAFSSGLYFVLFPGFLQQTSAIEYYPHQLSLFCFALSLCLMVAALFSKNKIVKIALIVVSAVLALIELLLMECFIGLEAMRIMFIIFYMYMRTPDKMARMFPNAFKTYLPWLGSLILFIILRNSVFVPSGMGEDFAFKSILPLMVGTDSSFTGVAAEVIRNIGKNLYGSWFVTVHALIDGLSVAAFWPIMIRCSICMLVYYGIVQLYWNLGGPVIDGVYKYARDPRRLLWQAQWLIVAIISMLFILLPFLIGGNHITLNSIMDWIAYPAGMASSMFMAGMMFQLRVRNYEWCMMVCLVGLGAIAQIAAIFA